MFGSPIICLPATWRCRIIIINYHYTQLTQPTPLCEWPLAGSDNDAEETNEDIRGDTQETNEDTQETNEDMEETNEDMKETEDNVEEAVSSGNEGSVEDAFTPPETYGDEIESELPKEEQSDVDVVPTDSESDSESHDSNISKRTLELGEVSTGSESPEREPDSQVSSGWLGAAYNRESRAQKRKLERLANNQRIAKDWRVLGSLTFWQSFHEQLQDNSQQVKA